ncbi:MAG: GNAT family N-acetyltransferase [Nitrospiraceae bacterium]
MAIRVELVEWTKAHKAIRHIRDTVFVREQGVPLELEWDGQDPLCRHVLAWNDQGEPIGTGRLYREGMQARLARMAVLKEYRGRGVGRALLRALLAAAEEQGLIRVYLSAQVPAIGFYEKAGFSVTGELFQDAGMPHRPMALTLPRAQTEPR